METLPELIPAETTTPAGNLLIKVNNRNTITRNELCSKLTIKRPERRQGCLVNLTYCLRTPFIVNFEHISHLARRENAEIRALYWKEERKVSLTHCKLKYFLSRI